MFFLSSPIKGSIVFVVLISLFLSCDSDVGDVGVLGGPIPFVFQQDTLDIPLTKNKIADREVSSISDVILSNIKGKKSSVLAQFIPVDYDEHKSTFNQDAEITNVNLNLAVTRIIGLDSINLNIYRLNTDIAIDTVSTYLNSQAKNLLSQQSTLTELLTVQDSSTVVLTSQKETLTQGGSNAIVTLGLDTLGFTSLLSLNQANWESTSFEQWFRGVHIALANTLDNNISQIEFDPLLSTIQISYKYDDKNYVFDLSMAGGALSILEDEFTLPQDDNIVLERNAIIAVDLDTSIIENLKGQYEHLNEVSFSGVLNIDDEFLESSTFVSDEHLRIFDLQTGVVIANTSLDLSLESQDFELDITSYFDVLLSSQTLDSDDIELGIAIATDSSSDDSYTTYISTEVDGFEENKLLPVATQNYPYDVIFIQDNLKLYISYSVVQ